MLVTAEFNRKARRRVRSRFEAGLSAAELLVVLAILSLSITLAALAWRNVRGTADVSAAARIVKSSITRARMLSVYSGDDHFVVLDPALNTVAIYRDSQAPKGQFDARDERVSFEPLPGSGGLRLPPVAAPLVSPFGGQHLTDAWSLPLPDTRAAWGGSLRGFTVTATGQFFSAESLPIPIVSGVMVFSDGSGQAAAVGVRGQAGNARAFRLLRSGWAEL